MQVKIKVKRLHVDATIPTYATDGSGCFDIYATNIQGATLAELEVLKKFTTTCDPIELGKASIPPNRGMVIETGLSFEIPDGHVMLIFSRSGHGFKNNIRLSNCVGVIDSDYRGELKVKLVNDANGYGNLLNIKTGDRIAQAMIIPIPKVNFEEVEELPETERGEMGFGSTGS